ncbi:MAG: hypothetical protein HC817_09525 [Saprospiraceae bacterium]|nr:hypothetical protein [Saprospiraceae bacterium]
MAEIKSKIPDPEGGKPNVARQFLLVALLGIAGFLMYKIFSGEDVGSKTSIPKAMQMTYVPSDFKMNLDEQKTLETLSNPQRYKREFDELILNFNTNLVVHVANRMGLNNALRSGSCQ